METDGRPQGAGAVIDPRQHQPGHQILEHQQEIRDVPVHHRELPHMQQGEQQAAAEENAEVSEDAE